MGLSSLIELVSVADALDLHVEVGLLFQIGLGTHTAGLYASDIRVGLEALQICVGDAFQPYVLVDIRGHDLGLLLQRDGRVGCYRLVSSLARVTDALDGLSVGDDIFRWKRLSTLTRKHCCVLRLRDLVRLVHLPTLHFRANTP